MGTVVLAGDFIHPDRDGAFSQKYFPFLFPHKSVEVATIYNGNRSGEKKEGTGSFPDFAVELLSFHLSMS